MSPPTITGTPTATSFYADAGPLTVSGYTHPSGDDVFVVVAMTYNGGVGVPTGVTHNAAAMTKVDEIEHTAHPGSMALTLWRRAATSDTTGDIVVSLPGSSDFIGTVVVFSGNGVASLGTMVEVEDSFDTYLECTVTDGTTNSLMLAMSVSRRSAAFPALADMPVTSNGTDLVNTGNGTSSALADRTCVFTKAGSTSVTSSTTYTNAPDRCLLMMLALNGAAGAAAVVTGTMTASVVESDIVAGGKTFIITLTGDTWVPA